MISRSLAAVIIVCTCAVYGTAAGQEYQSTLSPARAQAAKEYPKIVLYSVAWCPHCKEAKEYLTRNSIPFINRDVEVDEKAMEEVSGKYHSNAVPVIIIGTGRNEVVVKGFSPALFETSLKKAQSKK